ncbi:MAG: hypothetical protein JHC81_10250 [Brevundimonas sp.]|uniref:hypothetical protein n=1 Tax=Brevundimonas sp. TaxID=1871086 RepID=UPI001A33114C|nr:hypothetical protein [Brevundimonas sp.]MBJ7447903.1 hypothetical protein [Brevundimonas sp.]
MKTKRSLARASAAAAALLTVCALPTLAEARTCPSINLNVQQVDGEGYDPGDYVDTPIRLRLQSATGRLNLACLLVPITIKAVGSQSFPFELSNGSADLDTDFDLSSNAFRLLNQIRLTPSARAKIVAGEAVVVTVGEIDAGQFTRSGPYSAQVEIEAGDSLRNLTVSTVVRPVMRLARSSADGVESIDLGDPRQGATGSTSFFYRSNADIALTVTSENQGKLVHTEGASTVIPYTASIGGQTLSLTGAPANLNLGYSSLGLQSREVTVTVPPTGPVYAGRYNDTLTLSFTPY